MISRVDAVKEQLSSPRLFCQLPEEETQGQSTAVWLRVNGGRETLP